LGWRARGESVFWRKKKKENPILGLRELLFSRHRLDESLNVYRPEIETLEEADPDLVLGVVTEMGMRGGAVIIAGFANGDARMLWTSGGGLLGDLSVFPNIANAAKKLVETAGPYVSQLPLVKDHPLPERKRVRISILTPGGVHATDESEAEIQMPAHPLFDLFVATNSLITELRQLEEGRMGSQIRL
jgi:hypothetical protein